MPKNYHRTAATPEPERFPPVAMRIREFCRRYSTCRSKVFVEIKEERLAAKKDGRSTLIEISEGDRWFAALPPAGPKAPPSIGDEE